MRPRNTGTQSVLQRSCGTTLWSANAQGQDGSEANLLVPSPAGKISTPYTLDVWCDWYVIKSFECVGFCDTVCFVLRNGRILTVPSSRFYFLALQIP